MRMEERYYQNIVEIVQVDVAKANELLKQGYEILTIREITESKETTKGIVVNTKPVIIMGKKASPQVSAPVAENIEEKLNALQWTKSKNKDGEVAPANEEIIQLLKDGKVVGKHYTYYLTKDKQVLRFPRK